jgi:hypothetical protein
MYSLLLMLLYTPINKYYMPDPVYPHIAACRTDTASFGMFGFQFETETYYDTICEDYMRTKIRNVHQQGIK